MTLPPLILITDRRRCPRPLTDAVDQALSGVPAGAAAVLLREKDLLAGELVALAKGLRAITNRYGAPLIVSGRWDAALAAGADGVHLGGEAPFVRDVRPCVPAAFLVGVSLHGEEVASEGASYALISPIFATASKPFAAPIGLDGVRNARRQNPSLRLFALGGITDAERARTCLECGADGVALLGAVLTSPDPGSQARRLYAGVSTSANA